MYTSESDGWCGFSPQVPFLLRWGGAFLLCMLCSTSSVWTAQADEQGKLATWMAAGNIINVGKTITAHQCD